MADIPETRYTRSGDADIAYQVWGTGPDLVAIHGLPGHLEVMWELPEFAAFLDRLGTFGRVIMFDKRGTGWSPWPIPCPNWWRLSKPRPCAATPAPAS